MEPRKRDNMEPWEGEHGAIEAAVLCCAATGCPGGDPNLFTERLLLGAGDPSHVLAGAVVVAPFPEDAVGERELPVPARGVVDVVEVVLENKLTGDFADLETQ